jgi:hypothetical protein
MSCHANCHSVERDKSSRRYLRHNVGNTPHGPSNKATDQPKLVLLLLGMAIDAWAIKIFKEKYQKLVFRQNSRSKYENNDD